MALTKNPLYIVKKKENVVEEIDGTLNYLFSRLGIRNLIEAIETIFHNLLLKARDLDEIKAIMAALDEVIARIKFFIHYRF